MKNNNLNSAKNPFIILLIFINICLIEHGFTTTAGAYQYLWLTIPLLIVAVLSGRIPLRKKTPGRRRRTPEHQLRPHLLYHLEKVRNS